MNIEGKARVLLVEDEADGMDVLQETLLSLSTVSFQFVTATNGREALDQLRTEPIDLVLADILMPEMSGLEMLRQMHTIGLWVPCIFVTSLQRREAGIEAMRLGAFDFIEKPLTRSRLEEPLLKALYVSRAFQQFTQEQERANGAGLPPETREILKLRAMRYQNRAGEW